MNINQTETPPAFYDDNEIFDNQPAGKSILNKIWDKTWRLWAAIGLFIAAWLVGWLIFALFESMSSSGGTARVRVGGVIAPLMLAWYGLKKLIGFFKHLFTSEE